MSGNMQRKKLQALVLTLSMIISTGAFSDAPSSHNTSTQTKIINSAPIAPVRSYSYAYASPVYSRPLPPYLNRHKFKNRNRQQFNSRNDWFGDNRLRHWNRTMTNVISDLLGDGADDFEFDINIRFNARGKGKGHGDSRINTRASQNYRGDVRGDARNRGRYSGRTDSRRYSGHAGGYGHPPYYAYPRATHPVYPVPPGSSKPSGTYKSWQPLRSATQQSP